MFTVSVLCLAAFSSMLCNTDAAITIWTTPSIAAKDGNATVTVPENTAVGATIQALAVTITGGGTATFSIVSQPTSAKLAITSGNLVLNTGKSFDYETETSYIVVVKCVDSNDTAATGTATATITLSITNVNEAPVFASSQYAATIPSGSGAGTTLQTVKATDQDTGNTVTYGLDSASNSGSVFTIASTGIITVASSKTTDAATVGGYKLLVTAADNATTPLTATSTVWVAVTTCSSNSAALIASAVTMLVALVASLQ